MRVAVVLGTRPEIIKMSPLIRELKDRDIPYDVIHTGQHYDHEVSEIFFKELNLSPPDEHIGVGSGSQAEQTGKALMGLEKAYATLGSDIVLVQGDTNTVLAGALAAVKMDLKVGHVEAGLRSYDLRMPEEHNRRLTDHCSHHLFAPTENSADILRGENVWGDIHVTGNTVIDACMQNMEIAEEKSRVDIPGEYVLVTAHRAENVDDRRVLKQFLDVFENIPGTKVYPIHPRAEKMFKHTGLYGKLKDVPGMKLMKPQGYLEFLMLMKNARYILTDSGGIQEEATAPNIKKKVFVLRESTERPEAVDAGFAEVVGTNSDDILNAIDRFEQDGWTPEECPYGDGRASEHIVNIITG